MYDDIYTQLGSGMHPKEAVVWALQKALKEIEWLATLAHCKDMPSVVGTKGILEDAIKILKEME